MRNKISPSAVLASCLFMVSLSGCTKEVPPPDLSTTPKMPALTQSQKDRLEDVKDRTKEFEVSGLYALLENVSSAEKGAFSGVVKLDADKVLDIYAKPAEYRLGEPLLIEGVYVDGATGVPNKGTGASLVRQDWGDTLNVWVVRLARDPKADLLTVCFTTKRPPPIVKRGDPVRISARFYKLLKADVFVPDPNSKTKEMVFAGRTDNYQMFVGADAVPAPDLGKPTSPAQMLILVFVAVMGAGAGLLWLRWFLANSTRSRALKSPADRWAERLEREREEGEASEGLGTTLPTDPGLALAKLDDIHDKGMPQPTGDEVDLQPRSDNPFSGAEPVAGDDSKNP